MTFTGQERKECEKVIISDREYKEIQVIAEDDELIASITDKNIIEKEGYKVVCVPNSD